MALPTSLTLSIVTPDHSYAHQVDEVSLPGAEGDFGVLPGHTPLFAALRTGQMWYRIGAVRHHLVVSVGFVEVLPDRVSVLAQVAEEASDLDPTRAEAGMARNGLRTGAGRLAQDTAAAAGRITPRPLTPPVAD
jgi:F-type H+-transporting ATPase subunit epsilon